MFDITRRNSRTLGDRNAGDLRIAGIDWPPFSLKRRKQNTSLVRSFGIEWKDLVTKIFRHCFFELQFELMTLFSTRQSLNAHSNFKNGYGGDPYLLSRLDVQPLDYERYLLS